MTSSRILLADDDPVLLAVGSESLIAEGHDVVSAEDGDVALERFAAQSFDLLILDIDMPTMSGLSVLETIRGDADPARAATPVVMLTGNRDDRAIEACYDRGATSFIAKPVSWLNMTHQVAFILRASRNVEALRKARDLAEQASKAKDATMMTLRHELRSPLHVIKGFTDLLAGQLADRLTEEEGQYLGLIADAVEDMNAKMTRLYLYAEIISGTFDVVLGDTDIDYILRKASEALSPSAEKKRIDLKILPAQENAEIRIDEEKMLLAVTELLDNAVKFGPEGSTVTISCSRDETNALSITVEDEGDGIAGNPDRVFEAFVQGDDGLTRSSTGLGLGLTVARSVARRHGGDVGISNADGGGCRVTLVLADDTKALSAAA